MITGRVNAELEAIVPVRVGAPKGPAIEVEAAIDTGFNGFLALPPDVISRLELPFSGPTRATLGDGTLVHLSVYEAEAAVAGQPLRVEVLETRGGILVGTSLLRGSELNVQLVEGGAVQIRLIS
jgi:clan AA aspartic protease